MVIQSSPDGLQAWLADHSLPAALQSKAQNSIIELTTKPGDVFVASVTGCVNNVSKSFVLKTSAVKSQEIETENQIHQFLNRASHFFGKPDEEYRFAQRWFCSLFCLKAIYLRWFVDLQMCSAHESSIFGYFIWELVGGRIFHAR